TLLVSVIRYFIIGVRFRGDFIIPFRNAAVDRVELFVIHRLSNALQTDDVFIFRSADEDNALGVTTHHADLRHAGTHQRTGIGDHHDLVRVVHLHRANNGTVALGHLDGDNALRAARLGRVFAFRRTFTVAVLGDGQDCAFATRNDQGNHAVFTRQLDTTHAGRRTTHCAHGVLFKAHHFTGGREQHHFIGTGGQIHADQLIAFVQVHRDDPGRTWTAELGQRSFLHGTARGRHKDVHALFVLAYRQNSGDTFVRFQRQQVDDWSTPRATARFRQLIDFHPVQTAPAGEAEDRVVGVGH